MRQRAVELMSRTSLVLAVVFRPMIPLTELVSSELPDRTSSVNEPLVPTVTSPVKKLVTLLKMLVAPSATICERRAGTAARAARHDNDLVRRQTGIFISGYEACFYAVGFH